MIRIGISGWRYAPWRGVWYPEGVPQRRELEFCARHFPTVEINGSFYSLQRPESYDAWYRATPPGFVFAVKGSRYVTHLLRLRNVERPLANFFASGVLGLREKLGPLLWQFPPSLAYDRERLEAFFELLPRSTARALTLARRRDARMTGRARLAIDADWRLRHVVEVRHPSFVSDEFRSLARGHGIAIVVADTAGKWPNVKVRAPFDALALMRRLRLAWRPEGSSGGDDLPRHLPGARIPRVRGGLGPRVTGGSAWAGLGRASTSAPRRGRAGG